MVSSMSQSILTSKYNVLGLLRVVECLSTRTVDNYSSMISRTLIFGRKKKKKN